MISVSIICYMLITTYWILLEDFYISSINVIGEFKSKVEIL